MVDLSLVLVAGLLASLHCVGMCGPIVLAYSMAGGGSGPSATRTLGMHAAYNVGRVLSYSLLGALAGMVGMAFQSIQTIGEYVSVVGGALMIVAGAALLGILPLPSAFATGAAGTRVGKSFGGFLRSSGLGSKLALGILTPLLPCGVLYAMVLRAAATRHAGWGALVMAVFAVGMAPALMLMGGVSSMISARVRRGAERLAAVTVILMGVILVLRGLRVPYLSWLGFGLGGDGSASCH